VGEAWERFQGKIATQKRKLAAAHNASTDTYPGQMSPEEISTCHLCPAVPGLPSAALVGLVCVGYDEDPSLRVRESYHGLCQFCRGSHFALVEKLIEEGQFFIPPHSSKTPSFAVVELDLSQVA
jgi:hypothetical protein